jgi:hypothetical protein
LVSHHLQRLRPQRGFFYGYLRLATVVPRIFPPH